MVDGPFTEAAEVIGGFALIEAKSREDAVEHTVRFLRAIGGSESELHQLGNAPDLLLERALR